MELHSFAELRKNPSSSLQVEGVYTFLIDEDSGLGMELDETSPRKTHQPMGDGRRKASEKRPAEDLEELSERRFKRYRSFDVGQEKEFCSSYGFQTPQNRIDNIDNFLDESIDHGVAVDGSHESILPTIQGKHRDLKTISVDTMHNILSGKYDSVVDQVSIIDCRYPYEYQAGHIMNARNIYTTEGINEFMRDSSKMTPSKKHVLIFHCEFSSKRGPKLCRFLRSQDRQLNRDYYPRLTFPEIYVLEGGYEKFFACHKELCFPQVYKPMLAKEHTADLRHFRVKSKSWAAGDKPKFRTTELKRLKLNF